MNDQENKEIKQLLNTIKEYINKKQQSYGQTLINILKSIKEYEKDN
jgi:hypothetical protein